MHHLIKIVCVLLLLANTAVAQVTIKGTVQKIENGKDGYTATILTKDKKIYYAGISLPNMDKEHPNEYRRVSVGEEITIQCDDDNQYLAVRRLSPPHTSVKGVIKSIENEEDGYTATILTKDKQTYIAVISIANLADRAGYRKFKVGDKVDLEGEVWELSGKKRLTVYKIKK